MAELVTIGGKKADLEIADGRLVVRERRSEQLVVDAGLNDVRFHADGASIRLIVGDQRMVVRPEFITAADLVSYLEGAGEKGSEETAFKGRHVEPSAVLGLGGVLRGLRGDPGIPLLALPRFWAVLVLLSCYPGYPWLIGWNNPDGYWYWIFPPWLAVAGTVTVGTRRGWKMAVRTLALTTLALAVGFVLLILWSFSNDIGL